MKRGPATTLCARQAVKPDPVFNEFKEQEERLRTSQVSNIIIRIFRNVSDMRFNLC